MWPPRSEAHGEHKDRAEEQDHPPPLGPLERNALPGNGWALRGTRPRAIHDQRIKWAYIFGAICPERGIGAALVMPYADTDAMQAHLAEISAMVEADAHAVLVLDQAGWHMTARLIVPDNITLVPLPPRSPELNPVKNIWQFIRDNWLSNRVFKSYDDIVAHCWFGHALGPVAG